MPGLPHCKDYPTHVHCIVDTIRPVNHDKLTATYEADMPCKRVTSTWGVILAPKASAPLTGMHLLPSAVQGLPDDLRANAAIAAQTPGVGVSIVHTVTTVFERFATMTVAEALVLADEIDAAGAGH